MQLTILIGLVFSIGAVAFALQNNVPVTVTFMVWRFDSALAMVLLLALVIGVLIAALFSTPAVLRLQWSVARLRRQVNALEQINDELKTELRRAGPAQPTDNEPSNLAKMAPRSP